MSNNFYKDEYMPKVNKIGKLTGVLGVILAFSPAIALAVVYGILPKPAALLTAFISGVSAFGVLWFVEPISYYPVLGTAGTYMAFLSGNISNMRVPCASMAQVAADVEPGTEQGSIIATLGMAVSIIINGNGALQSEPFLEQAYCLCFLLLLRRHLIICFRHFLVHLWFSLV